MTLVSEMVRDGYREAQIVGAAQALTPLQETEGLRRLQVLASSVYGNEMGDPLTLFPLGRNNVQVPSGYPWGDGYPPQQWWVPLNARLVCNLTAALTSPPVFLHPAPEDGSRLGVVDASGNFATYNLVLDGNGRNIEGVENLVLNEDGLLREWVYRADLGQWLRVTPLAMDDTWPWPDAFDDMFACMLAMRLNPRYGQDMRQDSAAALTRSRDQFRARYHQTIPVQTEPGLMTNSVQTYPNNRRYWGKQPATGDSGWAYPGPWIW